MNTIASLKTRFPVGPLDHLEDIEVPVETGPNAQGDLSWYPVRPGKVEGLKPIPKESEGGLVILEGNNGHPHTLASMEGECLISLNPRNEQRLATVVVPQGAELLLGHNEHGYHIIGEGSYVFNSAWEQRDELRRLAD